MTKKQCSNENCKNEPFLNFKECALHCEKKHINYNNIHSLSVNFYTELIKYIIAYVMKENKNFLNSFGKCNELHSFLTEKDQNNAWRNEKFRKIGTLKIRFDNIYFPKQNEKDPRNYIDLLKLFGSLHFNYCQLNDNSLNLKEVKCFFQDCTFMNSWKINDCKLHDNENNVLFQNCTFEKSVYSTSESVINVPLFYWCTFKDKINFEGTIFKEVVFIEHKRKALLDSISIKNCYFHKKFNLKNFKKIKEIQINYSVFESNFTVISGINFENVDQLNINRTNFQKTVDFSKTQFGSFNIQETTFCDLALLDQCCFNKAIFRDVIFNSIANFRDSKFTNGLDIEMANFKESPNFLKSQISLAGSKRETFRVIKNSFDKIGNSLEANRFYALEMRKYREELKETGKTWEKLVFWINDKVSEFGQNYIRPVIIILILAVIYYLITIGYENNLIYKIYPPINNIINITSDFINNIAKSIIPFQKILKEGMESISLLFSLIFGVLIWQTIIAVKRLTKR